MAITQAKKRCTRLLPLAAILFTLPACRQQMADQPSYRSLQRSPFFADKRSARPLVAGTVARGHLREDDAFYRPMANTAPQWVTATTIFGTAVIHPFVPLIVSRAARPPDSFPLAKVAKELRFDKKAKKKLILDVLQRGQKRYNIYCAVCHDRTGSGEGMIVLRGYARPPSYHLPRIRSMPYGRIYEIITKGFGAMPAHASQIPPADRWAIAAYVRALQQSQNATMSDLKQILKKRHDQKLPASLRKRLEEGGK